MSDNITAIFGNYIQQTFTRAVYHPSNSRADGCDRQDDNVLWLSSTKMAKTNDGKSVPQTNIDFS